MMPALVPFPTMEALLYNLVAQGNFTSSSGSVNYAILIVSTLAVMAAVGIAIWQHRDLRRYRKVDQAFETQRAEQENLRQVRRTRRDSWEPVFKEIQELLIKLEDIESEARDQGPLDRETIDIADLGWMQRRLENVSDRCPDMLRDPLRAVAMAVARLRSVIIIPDVDVTHEYEKALTSTPPSNLPQGITASALGARAIEQYRAAVDLHCAIGGAWNTVHTERGGDLSMEAS
jgi:hypothetical protein